MIAGWSPGIGDPTLLGWLTAAHYMVAFIIAIAVARQPHRDQLVWKILAFALLFMGINKQLDLQSLAAAVGRATFKAHGLYEGRRAFQFAAIIVVLVTALIGLVIFYFVVRDATRGTRLAALGMALMVGFVGMRAITLEHVDAMLNLTFGGVRFNHVLENGAIAVTEAGAVLALHDLARRAARRAGLVEEV
jgi:hypothetical protein